MSYTIREIAEALGATAHGDDGLTIDGVAEPRDAGPGDLALAMKPEYASALADGAARAAIVWDGADWAALGLDAAITVPRPRYAMAGITRLLDPGPDIAPGIHPLADIHTTARIGADAAIGPFVSIGRDAEIGPRARIAPHASIGAGARLGADALVSEGARIGARVIIGDRFIAQPNCVIGGDGFSFVTPEKSRVEAARETLGAVADRQSGHWTRIHSVGTVEIGDDVDSLFVDP